MARSKPSWNGSVVGIQDGEGRRSVIRQAEASDRMENAEPVSEQGGHGMRGLLFFVTAAASVTVPGVPSASAQVHGTPTLNSCIREFYDSGMYNYLTFQNNCTHGVSLVFVAKSGSGTTGSMELRAGGKDSVGRSADGKVPKIGDFQLYVCGEGEMPVDGAGKVVSKPKSEYTCKAKDK